MAVKKRSYASWDTANRSIRELREKIFSLRYRRMKQRRDEQHLRESNTTKVLRENVQVENVFNVLRFTTFNCESIAQNVCDKLNNKRKFELNSSVRLFAYVF